MYYKNIGIFPVISRMILQVALTPLEERLFELLRIVCKTSTKPVVCRVVGGWVRDKLLGLQSSDIDIALDLYTGYDFAMLVAKYLKDTIHFQQWSSISRNENSAFCQPPDTQSIVTSLEGLTKIVANPEKSKHLETATARVFGLNVDFVNLRSRPTIPTREFQWVMSLAPPKKMHSGET